MNRITVMPKKRIAAMTAFSLTEREREIIYRESLELHLYNFSATLRYIIQDYDKRKQERNNGK